MNNIERVSYGTIYFPLSVLLLASFFWDKPISYFLSILVLTFADPAAAAVGKRSNNSFYPWKDKKSINGSLAMFSITFIIILFGTDIMANFFSKMASQDGMLKLFAGGRQIKSLVPVIDVARCFKFMEEREDLTSEIYNLTKDTVTVKDVAEICKKHNPRVTIKTTDDEIPNLGYTLSNKKLLKTAFPLICSGQGCFENKIASYSVPTKRFAITIHH